MFFLAGRVSPKSFEGSGDFEMRVYVCVCMLVSAGSQECVGAHVTVGRLDLGFSVNVRVLPVLRGKCDMPMSAVFSLFAYDRSVAAVAMVGLLFWRRSVWILLACERTYVCARRIFRDRPTPKKAQPTTNDGERLAMPGLHFAIAPIYR